MANLIIKPSAGGDLVIKGSDDSPAITVGTTGTTTFAEATTLSGGVAGNTTFTGNTTLSGSANSGAGFITHAQQFRLNDSQAGSASNGTVITDWAEVNDDYQRVGAVGWSQSSGIFSTTETGIYICWYNLVISAASGEDNYDPNIQIAADGSNYSTRSVARHSVGSVQGSWASAGAQFMFDVASTALRLRFRESEANSVSSNSTIEGSGTVVATNILFLRIGNT